eukprot:CAMPEP_0181326384 /NCGR_PEP_ID=MMETSP1101-20121128/21466_1 /TAXON_ID=46948 /ORGANISM="Rhodomonas abbreviata, Strain Caron Lab Isolate" /LENGTH=320 /DNA_ID=CAMNT_0023434827 /DNA_START=81 /DNA_END=1040 /DNA_ORIENTATION=+
MSGMISSVRTGVTAALWKKRYELEQYKVGATKPQKVLVDKAPSDSHMSIELRVATDPAIRDQYLNFRGGVQFGKLLEDVDAFAGNIAFLHCDDANAETKQHRLVTACVDRLDLHAPITLGMEDLVLVGEVGWAGRSSLQIDVQLLPKGESKSLPAGQAFARGHVVFVSVGEDGKGVEINPLIPKTPEEQHNFAYGKTMNAKRKEMRAQSLERTAPREEERELLHAVMMTGAPPSSMPLAHTALQSIHVMQPQERNRAGNIFGGFLMNKAYEVAFATASQFAVAHGGAPTVFSLDDVSFSKPVKIGDVICFSSAVVYTGAH